MVFIGKLGIQMGIHCHVSIPSYKNSRIIGILGPTNGGFSIAMITRGQSLCRVEPLCLDETILQSQYRAPWSSCLALSRRLSWLSVPGLRFEASQMRQAFCNGITDENPLVDKELRCMLLFRIISRVLQVVQDFLVRSMGNMLA